MTHHGNTFVSFAKETNFLTPPKKWSDKTGKVFDVEEPGT